MVFSSIIFIFYFLPAFLLLYYLTGARNSVLLFGSAIFYLWGEGAYIFLLLALVVANFYAGRLIEKFSEKRRPWVTGVAVSFNLFVLAIFKYLGFFTSLASQVSQSVGFGALPIVALHLPLGISFFTFQLISYLIDISRGSLKAERRISSLGTYIMMFPHLVAGPIVRYGNIASEIANRRVTAAHINLGIQYFVVGLSQKVLIANTVSKASDAAFALPLEQVSPAVAWMGSLSYMLQIYFDFCGYSNMAIGLAFLLGFHFPKNFDYPYASRSVTEFWRRWHMTLSFWFKDYVYIPLGGNRYGKARTLCNLLIVFALTGLWHGAAWTFVLWGLYHGTFLLIERVGFNRVLSKLPMAVQIAYVAVVVLVGWVFFRAQGFSQAIIFLRAMAGTASSVPVPYPLRFIVSPEVAVALIAGTVFAFPTLPFLMRFARRRFLVSNSEFDLTRVSPSAVQPLPTIFLLGAFLLCEILLSGTSLNPFLYFRF